VKSPAFIIQEEILALLIRVITPPVDGIQPKTIKTVLRPSLGVFILETAAVEASSCLQNT
jgi:hypothetical protein